MKLLKRKILFILASEIDFFNQTEGFEYQPYKFLYSRLLNYQPSSIRDAILQLTETGEVDKIVRNAIPLFRITSQGRDRLLSFFIISIGQKKVWDRIWRIAILRLKIKEQKAKIKDKRAKSKESIIEKKQMRKLRKSLKKMGFKKLSRGIYITPLPISAKLRELLLESSVKSEQITCIESRRLISGDDKQLAKNVWRLEQARQAYNQLISRINKLLMVFKQKKRLLNKSKTEYSLILSLYFSLLSQDPGLPKKLLDDQWPLDLAKERFLKLASKVKELER